MNGSDALRNGQRFVGSTDPAVIMELPGCVALAQNVAHKRVFATTDLPVFTEAEEYLRGVGSHLERMGRSGHEAVTCYCETRDAILALRAQECVFEHCFQLYGRFQSQRSQPLRGLEFLLEEQNGRRRYSVWRVHARLLGIAGGGSRGMIEARLVLAEDTYFVAEGGRGAGLRAHFETAGERLIDVCAAPPSEEMLAYVNFEQDLDECIRRPGHEIEILRKSASRFAREDFLYPALGSIVETAAHVPEAQLPSTIRSIQSRLWDGPLLANLARGQFERHLSTGEEMRLARLRLTLSQLELEDQYVAAMSL